MRRERNAKKGLVLYVREIDTGPKEEEKGIPALPLTVTQKMVIECQEKRKKRKRKIDHCEKKRKYGQKKREGISIS